MMRDLEETLKYHVDLHAKGRKADAARHLRRAWAHEQAALTKTLITEWAEEKKRAIDAYVDTFHAVMSTQACGCPGLCRGGAACADVPITGKCPVCKGPARVCKPRHAKGMSCD
jgi:hypothetical protein